MNLLQWIPAQFLDDNADPLSGGKIYAYEAGTGTPQNTYTDQGGGTPNANPVILDSAGRADIWIDQTTPYKFVITDSADVTIKTVDNVGTTNEITGADLEDNIELPGTEGFRPPDGTTLQRPSTPVAGETRYNSDDTTNESYLEGFWVRALTKVVSKTTTYTATTDDDTILCDTSGGAWTLTLPSAATYDRKEYVIKKTTSDFDLLTIDGEGSETIDGASAITLATQNESVKIKSDGTNWHILSRDIPQYPTSYTPSATWSGTDQVIQGLWTRRGMFCNINGRITVGSTLSGTGLNIGIPSGLTMSTSSFARGVLFGSVLPGAAYAIDSTVNDYPALSAIVNNSTTVFFQCPYDQTGSSTNAIVMLALTNTFPFSFGNADAVEFNFDVPIHAWKGR